MIRPDHIRPSRRPARWLARGEALLSRAFESRANPFHHLGALTIYCFYIALVTGIYLFVFYRASLQDAWQSVQAITHGQWFAGGVMRSVHRYSSDAAVFFLSLHLLRELVRYRHNGPRWFSWVTGMPLVWIVLILGISGYWMVWDQLAAWTVTISARLMDWLPIFTEPMSRNFLDNEAISGRLFTLIAFIHLVGLPVILVLAIWFHLLRVRYPRVNPPRSLMVGSLVALLVLAIVFPVTSHPPADLNTMPGVLAIDWFYLAIFPLQQIASSGFFWLVGAGGTLALASLPWLLPHRRQPVAEVHLPDCTGCGFCAEDCPYGAIDMVPRSDDLNFEVEARVNASLCVSCGICTGACPSSSPFRQRVPLTTGIEMSHFTLNEFRHAIRGAEGSAPARRGVLVLGCEYGLDVNKVEAPRIHAVQLPCLGAVPPAGIDYALRRAGYAGVAIAGCAEGDCYHRLGDEWTRQRIGRQRQPMLRNRVPRDRLLIRWDKMGREREFARSLDRFLAALDTCDKVAPESLSTRRTGT